MTTLQTCFVPVTVTQIVDVEHTCEVTTTDADGTTHTSTETTIVQETHCCTVMEMQTEVVDVPEDDALIESCDVAASIDELIEDSPYPLDEMLRLQSMALDPCGDLFGTLAMTTEVELLTGLGTEGELYGIDEVVAAIEAGTITAADARAAIESRLAFWDQLANADLGDHANSALEHVAVFVVDGWSWLSGRDAPLEPVNQWAEHIAGRLRDSLTMIDGDDPAALAAAVFHASTVDAVGRETGTLLTHYRGAEVVSSYIGDVAVAGDIVQTSTTYVIGALSATALGPGAIPVAATWNTAVGSLFSKHENYALYGEAIPDEEAYHRQLLADGVEGAAIGSLPFLGRLAAGPMSRVAQASAQNPVVRAALARAGVPAEFLASRLVGGAVGGVQATAMDVARYIELGRTPQGEEWLDFGANAVIGMFTGAVVPQPEFGFLSPAGAPFRNELLRRALAEGTQEVAQDVVAAALRLDLGALTVGDAMVTFLASSVIGGLTGDGDFDFVHVRNGTAIGDADYRAYQAEVAAERAQIVDALREAGVAPEVVASFEIQQAIIADLHVLDPNAALDPGRIDQIIATAEAFADDVAAGTISVETIARAMLASSGPAGSTAPGNAQHLSDVWAGVQASSNPDLEFLQTVFTDAFFKGLSDPSLPLAETTDGPQTLGDIQVALDFLGGLADVAGHGIPHFDVVRPYLVGMEVEQQQAIYESILAHHASGFPSWLMGTAGVQLDFDAMVEAGHIRAERADAIAGLYDAALPFFAQWRPVINTASSRTPPVMTADEFAGFMAAAEQSGLLDAVDALPSDLSVQYRMDDATQFMEPGPKWFGIGLGDLARRDLPRTFGNLWSSALGAPASGYYMDGAARGTEQHLLALSGPSLEAAGFVPFTTDYGAPGFEFVGGDANQLAQSLRDTTSIHPYLGLDVSDASDQAIVDAFMNADLPSDAEAIGIAVEIWTNAIDVTVPAQPVSFDTTTPEGVLARLQSRTLNPGHSADLLGDGMASVVKQEFMSALTTLQGYAQMGMNRGSVGDLVAIDAEIRAWMDETMTPAEIEQYAPASYRQQVYDVLLAAWGRPPQQIAE